MSFLGLFSTICQVYQGAKHTVRMKTFFSPFVPGNNRFKLGIYLFTTTFILNVQIIVANNPPNGQKYSVVYGDSSAFP